MSLIEGAFSFEDLAIGHEGVEPSGAAAGDVRFAKPKAAL